MIMSTQSHVVGARAPGLVVVVVQSLRTRMSNVIERIVAHKQARAEREVRAVLASFSAERLAGYGWPSENIRRLKSCWASEAKHKWKQQIMSTQQNHIAGYVHHVAAPETSQPAARAVLDTVALPLRRMLSGFIRGRALRRAENELMGLDDRMLRDIGLSRTEIASAVRNPAGERLNGARSSLA
jgi:uncharacterized protein YjiS (DUF1127 family)